MEKEDFYTESKNKFLNFLNSLNEEDNIGIFAHEKCLDGVTSSIFAEEILGKKNLKFSIHYFGYSMNLVKKFREVAGSENLNKIIILDIGNDEILREEFEEFNKNFEVFVIDHHPPSIWLRKFKNTVILDSQDCPSWFLFEFGKDLFDYEKWKWLLCSTMIHEFSHLKKEHFDFIKKNYPSVSKENINESEPGEMMKKLSSVIIFNSKNISEARRIIKEKDLEKINEAHAIISREFDYWANKFKEEKEILAEGNLYFYFFNPKYGLGTSGVTTKLSLLKPEKIWAGVNEEGNNFKISLRSNGGNYDLNVLINESSEGMKNVVGGGHAKAAGVRVPKKDFETFKNNLVKSVIDYKK